MKRFASYYSSALIICLSLFTAVSAQKSKPTAPKTPSNLPKVTQIDEAGLRAAIKPNGKPVLVNFWATWCDPCREEFPDLVKLDAEFKGRVDFVTISLDDLAEIDRDVPKFLGEMKATMPSYLLKVADEGAVISSIAGDWSGGLPFTIIYKPNGETSYFRQGIFKVPILRAEIERVLSPAQ